MTPGPPEGASRASAQRSRWPTRGPRPALTSSKCPLMEGSLGNRGAHSFPSWLGGSIRAPHGPIPRDSGEHQGLRVPGCFLSCHSPGPPTSPRGLRVPPATGSWRAPHRIPPWPSGKLGLETGLLQTRGRAGLIPPLLRKLGPDTLTLWPPRDTMDPRSLGALGPEQCKMSFL